MREQIKLGIIPDEEYSSYRYDVIFKAYKWDPQVEDYNTISKYAVLLNRETAAFLGKWAEKLAAETVLMEQELMTKLPLVKQLGLPKKIYKTLPRLSNYDANQNVRLMRFDFHPTNEGWSVSEVNSDVPGGLAEASIWPKIAAKYFEDYEPAQSVADSLLNGFQARVKQGGTIAFVHATSYSDDRQVMQFLSDYFTEHNYKTLLLAPDHIKWENQTAFSILAGAEGKIDGIIRFFPLEWLENLPRKSDWQGYYDTMTPSCNHPIAILTQSKRLPLIWDGLGIELPAWKQFLPATKNPQAIKKNQPGWIYKPALGRVGEGISIGSAIPEEEMKQIKRAVRLSPKDWVAQEMFESRAIEAIDHEAFHICLGVYTVNGKSAGFYARMSSFPRIDGRAKDVPVLVERKGKNDDR